MDALILSCGTGGGHNTAGRAVEQELVSRGHRVTFLNPYDLKGPRASGRINNAYITLAQRAPAAFGAIYGLGNAYRRLPGRSPVYHLNRSMEPVLRKYLDTHPCDAIVMTHLFPAEIVTRLRRRGYPVPPTYFIATDYTCIPFTEETDCDRYIIPSPDLMEDFLGRGLPEDRLFPLGIPVRQEFTRGRREEARARLGFREDRKYVLLAGGSIGAGSLEESVRVLSEAARGLELTVICGNNQRVYRQIKQDYGWRATVLDHTDAFADYMLASDIFATKPGGLSSTEAAAIHAALVHVTPIPGCETKNMEFFASRGMSLAVRNTKKDLASACETLLDEAEREKMRKNQLAHLPRNAAENICDLMEEDCGASEKGRACEVNRIV